MIVREFIKDSLTFLVYADFIDTWVVVFKLFQPDNEEMDVFEEILPTATNSFKEAEKLVSKVDEEYLDILFTRITNQ